MSPDSCHWITKAQNSKLRKHDTSLEQLCLKPPEVHLSLCDKVSERTTCAVPERTRSQKRSRRWFPGWTPSHRSPEWSSPTQQRNTTFTEWPWSFLQTQLESRLMTHLFLKSKLHSNYKPHEYLVVVKTSELTFVYTSVAAFSRSLRVSGVHLALSLQQLAGMPFCLKYSVLPQSVKLCTPQQCNYMEMKMNTVL